MVNPYEQATALPPEPHEPGWRSFVSTPLILASATIWVGLIVCVYFVLPRVRTMLVGFGVAIGPLKIFGMDYAGLLLPLIGIAAGVCLAAMPSRRMWKFALFWLPLVLIFGLVLTVGPDLVKLLNDLA